METILFLMIAFVFGAFIGSFLNVCIHRLPRNESITHPPSRCYACGTRVQWYDNLPIIGWVILGGKCRWCDTPFSSRYLVSEIVVGLLTAGTWWYVTHGGFDARPVLSPQVLWTQGQGISRPVADALALICLLPVVYLAFVGAMIDREYEIIPDELTMPFQFAAPLLAAVAGTSFFLERPPFPYSWLMTQTEGGSFHQDVAHFLTTSWTVVIGAVVLLALSLTPMRWVYGPRLGEDAWTDAGHRQVQTGFWYFAVVTLVLLAIATVLALVMSPTLVPGDNHMTRLDLPGFLAVSLVQSILGSLVGWAMPWLVGLLGSAGFRKNAMGYGDVKFFAPLGAVLGPVGVFYAFFLAALVGTMIGLPKMLMGKGRKLRFGPCLAIAAGLVLVVGPLIHVWFLQRVMPPPG